MNVPVASEKVGSTRKSVSAHYYKTSEVTTFDCNPRTLKTVSLKCNRVRPLSRPISCCM